MRQFNVKSSHFVSAVMGPAGLQDTPVRLSADQLTAFTALRLIAMRVSRHEPAGRGRRRRGHPD